MNNGLKLLSDVALYSKYARHLDDDDRRETYAEVVTRNMMQHIARFPALEHAIREAYTYVYDRKVLPSMRSMQFGGTAVETNHSRQYNCSYAPVDHYRAFSETMFLLLGGTGVGYSVETEHIDSLPPVQQPGPDQKFLIEDSIMGWSEAVRTLVSAYLRGTFNPRFVYTEIREKGMPLITSGGKAPGPAPLRTALIALRKVLDAAVGRQLTSLEAHDMMCHIADAVLAGGIRRAAMIAFFSKEDDLMMHAKDGDWRAKHPWRQRANNSVVAHRDEFTEEDFRAYYKVAKESGWAEPGLFWTKSKDMRSNPCVEAALKPYTFCCLAEIAAHLITDQAEYERVAAAAAFINTLQASYTDFHYLRPCWKEATEKDALIGVGLTGIATESFLNLNHEAAAAMVRSVNAVVAKMIGINPAARCTLVKPSGTTSLVFGSSSGIHPWHSEFFARTMRINKLEPIHDYLMETVPQLMEDDLDKPHLQSILRVPCKSPDGAMTREESAIDLLNRVDKFYQEWVTPGHNRGENTHSISLTVSIRDDEWDEVGDWLWDNRDKYAGASLMAFNGGHYRQAPFSAISEAEYEALSATIDSVDLSRLVESEDTTTLTDTIACAGGACELV